MSTLTDKAAQAGFDSFMATFGRVPDQFQLLHAHAPAAFAGYGLIRSALMQDRPAAALDLRTKELVFALLDTLAGNAQGARSHALAAMKQGLTLPELAEGLVQVIMVGGITTWNLVGADVMRACVDAGQTPPDTQGRGAEGSPG
ncbi:carboxymuconolactone decarboxylase family protein [Limobrevibacterium gyesilva]|uniref:Carboxymuconolactone decarboxylase family protein n=1 Tax=Limobrevibacterium gyesilva TaxID=2991712 RepID=A0AA42CHN0_9PROT|nr:carboxymuconolactone decarboxylase family protein [Limobrevibacterium gyesilva]MCW3475157.1 carboxymuconolactone decarboxylase family protein [Limobrevibacterium gyesilva]